MMNRRSTIRSLVRPLAKMAGKIVGQQCPVCGDRTLVVGSGKLSPALLQTWKIEQPWIARFESREFEHCLNCGSSLRVRQLASVITSEIALRCNTTAASLNELCCLPVVQSFDIAEINSLGLMHPYLAKLKKLRFSEYGSTDPAIPNEDLLGLSYADKSFDFVFTSETLEHVPDVNKALSEIHRVLRPNGAHIFTIPVVWDRPQTVQRAKIEDGKLTHRFPPSYHAGPLAESADFLVFSEFGADVEKTIKAAGFALEIVKDRVNPALCVFISRKP